MNNRVLSKGVLIMTLFVFVCLCTNAQFIKQETNVEYEKRINGMLHQKKDVWGEEMITTGGATYEKMQGYLRPLFYSAGVNTWEEQGVHNILFAEENGVKPLYVALCDGSRLAMNRYDSKNDITIQVGADGKEVFGSQLSRLKGPFLTKEFYPILQTGYISEEGVEYTQESFATRVPGMNSLVAMLKISAKSSKNCFQEITIKHGINHQRNKVSFSIGNFEDSLYTAKLKLIAGEEQTFYYLWSPGQDISNVLVANELTYETGMASWINYWDKALSRGVVFNVPESVVMNSQKNLLIQNLVLRHRYSLGNGAYDEDVFHPEAGDAATTLLQYGYPKEGKEALESLYGFPLRTYYFWEKGERLSHGAEYFEFTKDKYFLQKWHTEYQSYLDDFVNAIKLDSRGLLTPQALSSDIATDEYYTHSQTVAWRGMNDMANLLKSNSLLKNEAPIVYANKLKDSILAAMDRSKILQEDGSLFMPVILYDKKKEVYSPITATRLGSYWNLVIPYAFDSGIFDYKSENVGQMLNFMHQHGGMFLGMLRFNFYGTPIGSYREKSIPAYYTTGVDNVYLLCYIRTLAQRDDVDRLILSFYGRLVHGQSPNTFCSGEGDNLGVYPGVKERCSFGSWNSGNNATWLQTLRLMLLRESYDFKTATPQNLYLAHATPREWLENGKTIEFENAPTVFGETSCRIISCIDKGSVRVSLDIPTRDPIKGVYLKLRLPNGKKITGVKLNGANYAKFDPTTEVIDLSGLKSKIELLVTCK